MAAQTKNKNPLLLILCLLLLTICTGCIDIQCAILPSSTLTDGWHENTALKNSGLQLLGLEKWCGSTYEIGGRYPAILTVNTIRSIMLTDEIELQNQVQNTITTTFNNTMTLEQNTSGTRTNQNNHHTQYIIYDGYDHIKKEQVKIIGEVWNCPDSGTSILCIGIAYITNQQIANTTITTQWNKIISDPYGSITTSKTTPGLLYQVHCH